MQVIIKFGFFNDKFYLTLRGHCPNPKFEHVIWDEIGSYEQAYWTARKLARALNIASSINALVFNDSHTGKLGDVYCDHMAFEKLPVTD